MKNLLAGLGDFWRAKRLLFRDGLWPLFLVPGILSLVFLPLSITLGVFYLDDLTGYLHDRWVPDFLQSAIMEVLLWIVLAVVGVVAVFALYRNVIMILYSPILGFLSEAVERRASPREGEPDAPGFSWKATLRSAGRGTTMSLLTLLFSLAGLAAGFLVGLVPVIGTAASAILLPLFTMYLAGTGFCDPLLERRGYGVGGSLRFAWRNRGRVLGHGLGFTALLLIPAVGWFLAPSLGVVAGTLGTLEMVGGRDESAGHGTGH